ncbi:hypothetical protein D3800_14835 [Microcystis aeruginosa NIES-298]|uniref:hypothetical protein n=1 Tax=Microcystis aeruginosa TaxID=1126 RepID=UPI000CC7890D|nr:hypothetical protein [Microcystis aeruginosa]QHU84493.1 hypothetical protein D3800_14835 [Microcystis aeruginosa NIES-298]GBE96138.1 hypothetical protein NIES298_03880 [Microcystis aeruginosa NIES-298]
MVSEFIELRSPAGNNRVNHGIGVFWGFFGGDLGARGAPLRVLGGLGFFGFFGGGWAHAVRPYGFWGGWVFWGFFDGGWAHAVRPYGFWGGWVFWGFLVGVGRTRCAPTGFGGGFWGFFGVFWWGLGARDAPLRVLGGFFGGFRKNTSV